MNDTAINTQLLKTKSILYIEDEDNIRNALISTLELMCKKVYAFSSAEEALHSFSKIKPDIILSDISLEQMSGLEFIKEIRLFDSKIPIIILSAHTDTRFLLEANKLKLVEYLTKPTTFTELQSSLFLAMDEIRSDTERFHYLSDSVKYDFLHKILYDDDSIKKLSTNETNLLDFFIENKHRTLHIQEIKNCIWDDEYYATDTALKSLLHKLRQKIGKDAIQNVSGIGYYLNNFK